MKRARMLFTVLTLQLAVSGFYTVLPTAENTYETTTEVIVFYPAHLYEPTEPDTCPVPDPVYFSPTEKKPLPIISQPENLKDRIGHKDQRRDSLRGNGQRNNSDKNTRGRN